MTWIKSQVTAQNVILVIVALVTLGGWLQTTTYRDSALAARLSDVEVALGAQEREMRSTYERRDVLLERLKAIDDRLSRIELELATPQRARP